MSFIGLLIFVGGLVLGSFFNALIYRIGHNMSVARGRSKCPYCGHVLGFFDLIPVISYLLLRGRCRYCKKHIGWHYPVIELTTASIALGLYAHYGLSDTLLLALVAIVFLIPLFIIDARYYIVPDSISIPAIFCVVLVQWWRAEPVSSLLLGAAVAGGFFLAQYVVSHGRWIGEGDIRLGVLMGVCLGFPLTIVALALAYISGAFVGIGLLVAKKKTMSSPLPFGTMLTAATLVTMVYGDMLLRVYLGFIGLA